ncbi:hypothetical protein [Tenacibaculum maritimum]|uniref:hypothetical protein n=1 Tax=Tenacibaculum maritimum TaxID=107401 RepID=UPI003876B660
MTFKYLTQLDLDTGIFSTLQKERSDEDTQAILREIEAQNIALIKTKMKGRYDVDKIFEATAADRHYLIIKILVVLVVYQFIRRNAARKVPADTVKDYNWAMMLLEKIRAGKEQPDGLPLQRVNGAPIEKVAWANTMNPDNYI